MYIGIERVIYMRDFEDFLRLIRRLWVALNPIRATTKIDQPLFQKKMIGFTMMYGSLILKEFRESENSKKNYPWDDAYLESFHVLIKRHGYITLRYITSAGILPGI